MEQVFCLAFFTDDPQRLPEELTGVTLIQYRQRPAVSHRHRRDERRIFGVV